MGGKEKERERRTNGSDPRAEAEPLCSLIKPGVARLGGVCAVAGGVRVAPEGNGKEGGWKEDEGRGTEEGCIGGCRWRLERVAWVEDGEKAADRAGWIEGV